MAAVVPIIDYFSRALEASWARSSRWLRTKEDAEYDGLYPSHLWIAQEPILCQNFDEIGELQSIHKLEASGEGQQVSELTILWFIWSATTTSSYFTIQISQEI